MAAKLQIKPKDCSPLGKLILQHLEERSISMNELAKQAGISQPGLRAACLKRSNPTNTTLRKVSKVLDEDSLVIYTLASKGKLENLQDKERNNYLESIMREVVEISKEMNLVPPTTKPPKLKIIRALGELGFIPSLDDFLSEDGCFAMKISNEGEVTKLLPNDINHTQLPP